MRLGSKYLLRIISGFTLLLLAVPARGAAAPLMQSTALALVAPSTCPAGGCAAGQRLSLRFDFDPSAYAPSPDPAVPNVKICAYAPDAWAVDPAQVTASAQGEVTGKPYAAAPACPEDATPPSGYTLILARAAALDANAFADALPFSARLGSTALGSGRLLARLFEYDGTAWARTRQATTPTLSVLPVTNQAFVANDAPTCAAFLPCYVNSADDLPGGLGTGLKDALDAVPANSSIVIIGSYTIKSSTVAAKQPVTLSGLDGSARITFNGPGACSQPMLSLENQVNLRGLTVNDGICTSPNRGLIQVSSPAAVLIENNTLTGGENAITWLDSPGRLTVRFNQITANSGYALYAPGSTQKGALELTANNLNGNRAAPQVECAADATGAVANRKANHNFWAALVSAADSHCALAPEKRLGMAIAPRVNAPGVDAQVANVTTNKTYTADGLVAFSHESGPDFPLIVVNHGYPLEGGPPFTAVLGMSSPSPCSNYWDVFLADGAAPADALQLSFKYGKTPACLALINSNQYCDQTTASKYPLYWYSPAGNVTKAWDVTGARPDGLTSGDGQLTRCDLQANEISVTIDASGRPNLADDLGYLPFLVGVPVIKSFIPLASNNLVTVTWVTNNEPDITGFYVLRGLDAARLTPITDLIAHSGTSLAGKSYSFSDTGRTNGVTYYYRLQAVRADGMSIYSDVLSVIANVATATPTASKVPTFTATIPRPTSTFPPTRVSTKIPTRIPSSTTAARTLIPTATRLNLPTLTETLSTSAPGYAGTVRALTLTPPPTATTPDAQSQTLAADLTGTPDPSTPATLTPATAAPTVTPIRTATPTFTPTPTPTGGPSAQPDAGSPWLSLLLGLLAGTAVTGAAGSLWYFWLRKL